MAKLVAPCSCALIQCTFPVIIWSIDCTLDNGSIASLAGKIKHEWFGLSWRIIDSHSMKIWIEMCLCNKLCMVYVTSVFKRERTWLYAKLSIVVNPQHTEWLVSELRNKINRSRMLVLETCNITETFTWWPGIICEAIVSWLVINVSIGRGIRILARPSPGTNIKLDDGCGKCKLWACSRLPPVHKNSVSLCKKQLARSTTRSITYWS